MNKIDQDHLRPPPDNRQFVALALGSNMGDRVSILQQAIQHLADVLEDVKCSSLYETDPMYVEDQPRFINMALNGYTRLPPLSLLKALKDIEKLLGRTPGPRFGPRPIDLDIIFYGQEIFNHPDLTIPHNRYAERRFVLEPLGEIMPDFICPLHQKPLTAQLDSLAAEEKMHKTPLPFFS